MSPGFWIAVLVSVTPGEGRYPIESAPGECRAERIIGGDGVDYHFHNGVSPDGRTLSFGWERTVPQGESERGAFLLDLATGERTRLPVLNNAGSFSPDGTRLVTAYYTGSRGLQSEIVEYDLHSQTMRFLAPAGGGDWLPSYAPDGRSVIFNSFRNRQSDLYRVDLGSGEVARLTEDPGYDAHAGVSADGRTIVFHRQLSEPDYDILLMRLDDGSVETLIRSEGEDAYPAMSPDGALLAFSSDRDSNRPGIKDIYLSAPNGSGLRRLTTHADNDVYATWSPDGRHLFYTSQREGGYVTLRLEIVNGDCRRA